MNINPEDKMIKNGRIEKWVLREAFKDYLPESVLWRQKEQFSDGVGYSWIDSLKELVLKKYLMRYRKSFRNISSKYST